ncbi:unnamed protein product [Urochloa humidicola]
MSPPLRRPPVPPELMDELLGEILLRIPSDEPAHLVRAALVCKSWLRILSNPAFRRGYRERHRRPPLLGFIHNLATRALSPASSPPPPPPAPNRHLAAATGGRSTPAMAGCSSTGLGPMTLSCGIPSPANFSNCRCLPTRTTTSPER